LWLTSLLNIKIKFDTMKLLTIPGVAFKGRYYLMSGTYCKDFRKDFSLLRLPDFFIGGTNSVP